MTSKNPKHLSKNQTQPEIKNQPKVRFVFSQNFKIKKTPNINSMHQMEQFDTKIFHFNGLNRC
jgi:hypothetical protein